MDPTEIRRLINNQKHEHVPHAFRAGSAGMDDFRRLYPVLRSLPLAQLTRWLRLIESMAVSHDGCLPCTSKILAYQMSFTRDLLPELHQKYVRRYFAIQRAHRPNDRDYLSEVVDHLAGNDDSPAAEAHRRNWKAYAMNLELDNRVDRE